jgi:hypothetical protein
MRLLVMLYVWLAVFPLSTGATVVRAVQAESWTTLPRDAEMEAFVETIFRLAGKPMRVPVVLDPAAEKYCAYASYRGSQAFIAIGRACVGYLRQDGALRWSAAGTLSHEVGHIVRGHIYNYGSHHWEETEADEFAGEMLQRLGATLEQALVRPSTFRPDRTDSHPERSVRMESYARGWMRAKAGQRQIDGSTVPTGWWEALMQRRLPWVR